MKHIYKTLLFIAVIFGNTMSYGQCTDLAGNTVSITNTIPPGLYTSMPSYTNQTILISGIVDLACSPVFTNATIFIDPGASVNILANQTLELVDCQVYSCAPGNYWDRIKIVDASANLIVTNTYIRDAEVAIDSENGGIYTIDNSNFQNNKTHIKVYDYNPTPAVQHQGVVTNSYFSGFMSNMAGAPVVTLYNFDINNVYSLEIGSGNTFIDSYFGIRSLNSSVNIVDNDFLAMHHDPSVSALSGTAIFTEGTISGAMSTHDINIQDNYIDRCYYGIISRKGIDEITIENNTLHFENENGIWLKKSNEMSVNHNSVSAFGTTGILCEQINNTLVNITHNTMNTGKSGIVVQHNTAGVNNPTVNIIQNDGIFNVTNGIRLTKVENANIGHNLIEYNTTVPSGTTVIGIKVNNSNYTNIYHNRVSALGSGFLPNTIGLLLTNGSENCIIENNYIHDCKIGVKNEGCTNNTFSQNKFYNCFNGFRIINDFSNIVLECNKLLYCDFGFYFDGSSGTATVDVGTPSGTSPPTPAIASDNWWDACLADVVNNSTTTINWYHQNLLNMIPVSLSINLFNNSNTSIIANSCIPPARLGGSENTATVNFFPNPTSGELHVESVNETSTLSLRDITGKLVHSSSLNKGDNTLYFDHLSKGIYQILIRDNDIILKADKLVIQ